MTEELNPNVNSGEKAATVMKESEQEKNDKKRTRGQDEQILIHETEAASKRQKLWQGNFRNNQSESIHQPNFR